MARFSPLFHKMIAHASIVVSSISPLYATVAAVGVPQFMHQRRRGFAFAPTRDCLDLVGVRNMWHHIPVSVDKGRTWINLCWYRKEDSGENATMMHAAVTREGKHGSIVAAFTQLGSKFLVFPYQCDSRNHHDEYTVDSRNIVGNYSLCRC